MLQGTTPIYVLLLDGISLAGSTVYVTFERGRVQVTKNSAEGDVEIIADDAGTILLVGLTQAETLAMKDGEGEVQARWIYADGVALGSTRESVTIDKSLLQAVIEYKG